MTASFLHSSFKNQSLPTAFTPVCLKDLSYVGPFCSSDECECTASFPYTEVEDISSY